MKKLSLVILFGSLFILVFSACKSHGPDCDAYGSLDSQEQNDSDSEDKVPA